MAQNLFAYFDNSPYHKPRTVHSSLMKLGITETKYITSHFPFFFYASTWTFENSCRFLK